MIFDRDLVIGDLMAALTDPENESRDWESSGGCHFGVGA